MPARVIHTSQAFVGRVTEMRNLHERMFATPHLNGRQVVPGSLEVRENDHSSAVVSSPA